MCFTERKILVKYHKLLENAKKPKGFWGKKMISSMNEGHYELTGWALDHINFERHYRVLDVGCGGGILSDSMARKGADVLGIDLATKALRVARLHALEAQTPRIQYREISAEALADEVPASFDTVTCLEMLEHVPDPQSVVSACARLVKPGGWVFFSTINRNPKAFALAIVGAEDRKSVV